MKEKILAALKTKYSNLGFGAKVLDGVASILEKSVTDESQIETAVGGVEPLLKVFQSDADRARTEYNALKGQYDVLKAKVEASAAGGGEQGKKNAPGDEEPAWFKAYKQQQEERYNAIKTESDTLSGKGQERACKSHHRKSQRTRYSGVAHERGICHRRRRRRKSDRRLPRRRAEKSGYRRAGRERFGIPDVHTRNAGQRARKDVGRNTSGQRIIKFQNHGNRI